MRRQRARHLPRRGGFLYATREAGRTWERIGPEHNIQPEPRNLFFQTLAASARLEDMSDMEGSLLQGPHAIPGMAAGPDPLSG
ncbi:hypothetical protein [Archangium violaceum]|uniref:hypothetical protein n=1 Tax=Archangium violaceum TaxID=83451 RepID=UPI00126A5E6D|nr:hypothetical protein [Archangium violaceum]